MRVFNNLTHKLEEFEPINSNIVTFYSCGPTVYDDSHIGHARSAITWDLLARYLRFKNYQVTWIRNITNVDDKIINRAKELDILADTLSRKYTYEFWDDMVSLNVSWPDHEPRATDYIPEMIKFIEGLIAQGSAYAVDGDVYFSVNKYTQYGQLKRQSIDALKEGNSRLDPNSKKKDQLDFALWKAFPNEPLSSFSSPWGLGRPGWHIECSTMIETILKEKFAVSTLDIHAGGDDLIFPHHENECAQSECFTGKPLAKYWLHNGMVMINGTKMSKSLNNYMTIKSVLTKFKPNTVRFFCLQTHYKKQINFTNTALQAAESGFDKLFNAIAEELKGIKFDSFAQVQLDETQRASLNQALINRFTEILDNDLATPQALALLFENLDQKPTVIYLLSILGFDLRSNTKENSLKSLMHSIADAKAMSRASHVDAIASLKAAATSYDNLTEANDTMQENILIDKGSLGSIIETLLELREKARLEKNFELSDRIRLELEKAGITIKDFKDKPSEYSFA
ncbi:MAG: cysteine--tRNA ligase [Candidatus Melainabacteria bacterium]|nr:cysteine--tRNA ligase [Candidatus Melainabacteria bacterium]